MSLGLQHGKNQIYRYSDDWPEQFKSEAIRILDVCGDMLIALEHVGSTSVPGLAAKPIVDMLAGVASLAVAEKMKKGMLSIGYDYPGDIGIPGDRIFGRDPGFRLFLLHVVEYDGEQWHRYLNFRNALRGSQSLAAEYANLKIEIAKKYPEGRGIYTELKSEFINRVLASHHAYG